MRPGDHPAGFDPARRAFLRGQVPVREVAISSRCLAANGVICRSCEEVCEPRAVSFIQRAGAVARPHIDLSRCTRCGECVPICPTTAIAITTAGGLAHGG